MGIAYFKSKRELIDVCNICQQHKKLTYDHVPPQGGIELKAIEIYTIEQRMAGSNLNKGATSQNGLKYRFICQDCNNKLGTTYDIELNNFTKSLALYLKSSLTFLSTTRIKATPDKIIRAVIGHLLAAKSEIDESKLDKQLRGYVFNEKAKLPDNLYIYYWVYPYEQTVLLRDFALLYWREGVKKQGFFQLLKYFPIAFLVTDQSEFDGLQELTVFKNLKSDVDIPIRLNNIMEHDYPERVDDNTVMFMSKETSNGVYARPKKGR